MGMKSVEKKWKMIFLFCYVVTTIVLFFLFFFDWDVRQTAASAYALLEGHIVDFYDYNYAIEGLAKGTIYEILIYIIFAIWNIPLYLLGVRPDGAKFTLFAIYWNKLIIVLFFFMCSIVIYKIAIEMKKTQKYAKEIAEFWCVMPLLYFLVIIQGSYDIFYVVFMLLGVLFWLKPIKIQNNILFNLFFGLAICIKPFPIFYYLILLFIREKNIWKICRNGTLMIIPYVICKVLYLGSEGYQAVMKFNSGNMYSLYFNAFTYLVPFILVYIFTCAKAYWYECTGENELRFVKETFYLCNIASFAFIGFSSYHPQWIMGAIPFWIFSMFFNREKIGYLLRLPIPKMGFAP